MYLVTKLQKYIVCPQYDVMSNVGIFLKIKINKQHINNIT